MKIKKKLKKEKFEEFYEYFVNSKESQIFLKNEKISTDLKIIKKPFIIKEIEKKEKEKEEGTGIGTIGTTTGTIQTTTITSGTIGNNLTNIPSPFNLLLQKQSYDGKWYNLEDVLNCIQIPYQKYFNNCEEWEEATIFALAKIRQNYELFNVLGDSHDKAIHWITSTNLIKKATEIIANIELLPPQPKSPSSLLSSSKKKITFDIPTDPYKKLLEQTSRFNYSRTMSAKLTESQEINNSEQVMLAQIEEQRKKLALTLLNPTVQYDVFLAKVLEVRENIIKYENDILQFLLKLDNLRKEILDCLNRCIIRYNAAILQSDRNASFDEFTASLGDDVPPRPGSDDWKKIGKNGFRTCVCKLLNLLHYKAIEKQRLRSLLGILSGIDWTHVNDPSSKQLSELINELSPEYLKIVNTKDDWTMRWDGKEIGKYILQSLNFIQKCSLLTKWYGSSYPFRSNPFSFSFPIEQLWFDICTDEMVSQYVYRYSEKIRYETKSLVSSNVMTVTFEQEEINLATQSQFEERLYRDHVINTQTYLQNITETIPNWWPKAPDAADIKYVDNLLLSFLVLRLLIRSNEDEAQGKLAAALTRSGIRSKKKSNNDIEKNIKEIEKQKSTDNIKGKNNQQPEDYKAWLFTDDWYTHYGPIQNQLTKKESKQTSPRQISTSQSENNIHGLNTYRQNSTSGSSTFPSPIIEKRPSLEKSFSNVSSKGNNSPRLKTKGNRDRIDSYDDNLESNIPPPSRETSKVDSKAKIIFQEQVYDLMNKDKDSIDNSLNEASGSLIISSTLTDDDDDDLISVNEIKTRSNIMSIEEEHSQMTEDNIQQYFPGISNDNNHNNDNKYQNFDELSSHSGNNDENNIDDDNYNDNDDDPEELKSIEENTKLVTDLDKHDTRHRLSTVSLPLDINSLEAVSKDAYKHIDLRQTIIPVPIPKEENIKTSEKNNTNKMRQTINSPQKSNKGMKKRGTQSRITQIDSNNISVSNNLLMEQDQQSPKQSIGKSKLMKLKNSNLLLAVSTISQISPNKKKTLIESPQQDQNKTSNSIIPTQIKPKLSLKEIKEKRKETLPARLKAAGLDQTFLPQQKMKLTTSSQLNPPLSPSSHSSSLVNNNSLPQITQIEINNNKKSKVTRVKLLSRESNIKLTRRVNENND